MKGNPMRGPVALFVACLVTPPVFAHPGHDQAITGVVPAVDAVFVAAADERPSVKIEIKGDYRIITSNGLPKHKTGRFPNRGNPNTISAQSYRYRVPAKPQAADKTSSVYGQPFGIALNGVPFDPGTAEVWSKQGRTHARGGPHNKDNTWNYDALSGKINLGIDTSNAHVQPNGAYHYHGIPTGLIALRKKELGKPAMVLVGYAADGFPVYSELAHDDADDASSRLRKMKPSYRLKAGRRPGGDAPGSDAPGGKYDGTFIQDFEYVDGLGDLDECNGRTGVTPEYPDGTYYYVLTDTFPMIPRAFRGTPDESFERRRGPGPRGEGPPHGEDDRRGPPRDGDRPPPPPRDGDRPPPPRR